MMIWGKVVGSLVGFALYGPVGIVVGLVFGQIFDNGLRSIMHATRHSEQARQVFFKSVFQTMGYMAKVDGVVSQKEIDVARDIMLNNFQLNPQQMITAMHYFNEGKQTSFDLDSTLQDFKRVCGRYIDLRRFFLELQIKAALADKVLHEAQRGRLVFICSKLNIPLSELEYQLRAYGFSYYTQHTNDSRYSDRTEQHNQHNQYTYTANRATDPLADAYRLLGVKPEDNTKTIKSAYRRLISKYHPDKLVSKGLPPEMLNVAKEKTQQITVAYDLVMRGRQ